MVLLPVLLGLGLGFGLSVLGLMPVPDVRIRWTVPVVEAGRYAPAAVQEAGEEIVLVYVGSSKCAWSNAPELPGIVRALKRDLLARARAKGRGFAAAGIARDVRAAAGLAHLEKFGAFDEVTAGRSWANAGVQKYMYGDMPGLGATPQILVVARTLDYDHGHVSITGERVLARAVGLEEITEWAAMGAPLAMTPGRSEAAPNEGG